MIMSIDADKALDNIRQTLLIKENKKRVKFFLYKLKYIYLNPKASSVLTGDISQEFSLKFNCHYYHHYYLTFYYRK